MASSNCLNCSKQFFYFRSNRNGKYCSNVCQQAYQRRTAVEEGRGGLRQTRAYLVEHRAYECSECQQDETWNGRKLTLQMDHIDGNPRNNRLDNVRWLCPNCHSQTETWGVQNMSAEGHERLIASVRAAKR